MTDAKRPRGVEVTITDTQQIVVDFDHGDIPPIVLSQSGAEKVGSHMQSAAHRADTTLDPDHYTEGASDR